MVRLVVKNRVKEAADPLMDPKEALETTESMKLEAPRRAAPPRTPK